MQIGFLGVCGEDLQAVGVLAQVLRKFRFGLWCFPNHHVSVYFVLGVEVRLLHLLLSPFRLDIWWYWVSLQPMCINKQDETKV